MEVVDYTVLLYLWKAKKKGAHEWMIEFKTLLLMSQFQKH
jgi:hypothetical protein